MAPNFKFFRISKIFDENFELFEIRIFIILKYDFESNFEIRKKILKFKNPYNSAVIEFPRKFEKKTSNRISIIEINSKFENFSFFEFILRIEILKKRCNSTGNSKRENFKSKWFRISKFSNLELYKVEINDFNHFSVYRSA